ncbi:hypothetical protein [Micromonospora sp. NPDC051141]|uniref:hypothetical protein n=1 Tax=Micromonospora sp. NPDC051141 TaxID=3364284 RepID=UPI00378E27DA
MRYLSDFKRAAVPGSRWMCINRTFPMVSGLRTITRGKTVLHYDAVKADGKAVHNGRMEWPKAAECRIDGDSVHVLHSPESDRISYTWTLLPDNAPVEALRPPRFIAAHPLNHDHRGPSDTPWCIFDTERARVVSTAGPNADGDGAYFATRADADTAMAKLAPPAMLSPSATVKTRAPAAARPSVYTLRPRTREERGCWCPFPPGCHGSPCVAGPRWKVRALVRQRHDWATASPTTVISEARRASELSRLADLLAETRTELRAAREPKHAEPMAAEPSDSDEREPWGPVLAEILPANT